MPYTKQKPKKGEAADLTNEAWHNLIGFCKALVELDKQAKELKSIYNNKGKEMSNEECKQVSTQGKPKPINSEGI